MSWIVFENWDCFVLISCIDSYQNQTHQRLPGSPHVTRFSSIGPSMSSAVFFFSGEGNSIDLSQSPCTPCPMGEATRSKVSNEKEATSWGLNEFFQRGVEGDNLLGIDGNLQFSTKITQLHLKLIYRSTRFNRHSFLISRLETERCWRDEMG